MKAIWKENETVLAESSDGIVIEGNYYFPPGSVNQDYLRESSLHTVCGWKGTASYYDIVSPENVITNAAWYYPDPKDAASEITNYVAFYRNQVDIVEN